MEGGLRFEEYDIGYFWIKRGRKFEIIILYFGVIFFIFISFLLIIFLFFNNISNCIMWIVVLRLYFLFS